MHTAQPQDPKPLLQMHVNTTPDPLVVVLPNAVKDQDSHVGLWLPGLSNESIHI